MEHQGGNCLAGGPPQAPRSAHQMQYSMLCSVQLSLYLEGGGGIALSKLSPGGLHHRLPCWGGEPDTGLDLVIGRLSGD